MFRLLTLVVVVVVVVVVVHVKSGNVEVRETPDPVANLTAVISQQNSSLNQLDSSLTALQTDLASKAQQIKSLTTQLADKVDQVENLTDTLSTLTHNSSTVRNQCQLSVGHLTNRVHVLASPIAFSARFKNDNVNAFRMGSYQNLIFDHTTYQTGGTNYNQTTGVFIAPSVGAYAFFISIQRNDLHNNYCLEASIIKNTNTLLATATACPSGYSSTFNMATIRLKARETVYVRIPAGQSESVFGYVHTTFSGFKLAAH